MGLNKYSESNKTYATVISDGSIRVKANENDPEAVKREYETSSGEKGEKWELVYQSIDGIITWIEFRDTDYGKQININVDDVVLSLNVDQSFAQDLMKKLPSIDLDKKVRLAPYSLITDQGRNLKGITVYQEDKKLSNYFYDIENKKIINGYPETEKNKVYETDDWKIYFIGVKKFLVKYVTDNIISKLQEKASEVLEQQIVASEIDDASDVIFEHTIEEKPKNDKPWEAWSKDNKASVTQGVEVCVVCGEKKVPSKNGKGTYCVACWKKGKGFDNEADIKPIEPKQEQTEQETIPF